MKSGSLVPGTRRNFIKDRAESFLVEAEPPAILLGKQGDLGFTRLATDRPDARQFRFVNRAMFRLLQFLSDMARQYFHKVGSKVSVNRPQKFPDYAHTYLSV